MRYERVAEKIGRKVRLLKFLGRWDGAAGNKADKLLRRLVRLQERYSDVLYRMGAPAPEVYWFTAYGRMPMNWYAERNASLVARVTPK